MWVRDVRYAIRVLVKSPVFALTAILTLGLCIGANTAIFTVVDRVLLRPLPYPHADRLALVVTHFDRRGDDETGQTGAMWEVLRAGVPSVELAATSGAFGSRGVNMVVGDRAEYVQQQRVSAGFFRTLGAAPALGREFTAEEDRPDGPAAAVLSDELWSRSFNRDPSIVGRALMLRGEPHTVVGVMPKGFTTGDPVDVWTPVRPCRTCEGGGQNYQFIARLRPGVSWPQADHEIAAAGQPVIEELYRRDPAHEHLIPLQNGETADVRQPLMVLWIAVGVVLLIGCVNVAGLLLARGATRAPEIATRMALGGDRAAIVRQLLAESVVLAACGGALGLAIGDVSCRLFATLLQAAVGVGGEVGLDARVLAVTGVAALLTSLVFGLLPAVHATRVDLRQMLVESGGHAIAGGARSWPRRLMVAVEVALGVVLLVGAGLLIRTVDHLLGQRAGFDGAHVMTATLSLQDARYRSTTRVNELFDRTLARMRELPAIERAAVCLTLPYERALNMGGRWASAKPGAPPMRLMSLTYVAGPYFETLRIPLVRGRYLDESDSAASEPVVIVNQTFVRVNSPDEDPIGRQIVSGGTARRIVGVVGDIQQKVGFGNYGPMSTMPATYIPASQTNDAMLNMVHTWFSPSWFVRVDGPPQAIAQQMQRAVQTVDPLLPFAKFRTFDELRGEAMATQRAQAVLLGTLAGLALLLAAVGLYGLVASSVAERTRELGIRMALGASTRRAVLAAAAPGILLGAIGVVAGLIAARFGAILLRHLVWGVALGDPATFAIAGVTVLAIAATAALVPSLRIVRLNPIRALRT